MEPRIKRQYMPRMRVIVGLLFIFILLVVAAKGIVWSGRFMRDTGITPGFLINLLFNGGSTLKSSQERTNILVLGVGGGTHEGADLTDTMMVVSVNSKEKTLGLLSLPRDIWSDTLKDRINSAYHYGEEKKEGGGLLLSRVVAEDVIGIPIHYSILIDFSGFRDLVDQIGGIDVTVEKAFTDEKFPIEGKTGDECPDDPEHACLYEAITFEKGLQHMDGHRALKYVRSRHAEGSEGSDFARGRRQQEVILALKQKLIQPGVWTRPGTVSALMNILDQSTQTDMNTGELATVAKRLMSAKEGQTQRISIEPLLTEAPTFLYGRYALIPIEDWETVQTYIKEQLGLTK